MNTSTRLLVVGLFASMIFAPFSIAAKNTTINVDYSGHGWDTETFISDDHPVTLSLANGKGTFGNSTIAVTVAFEVDVDMLVNCPDSSFVPWAVIDHDWGVVLTAADNSQLIGQFDTGWLCLDPTTGYYVGETNGEYTLGTGRFIGVSGTWVSSFEGYHPDVSIGFRSITGSIVGTVDLPWPPGHER